MRHRPWLHWLLLAAVVLGYELFTVMDPATGDTLSENVWALLMLDGIGPVLTAMALGFLGWLSFHFAAPAVWHHWQRWKDRRIITQPRRMNMFSLNGTGKFARHAAAWLVAAIVGYLGLELSADDMATLTAGVAVVLITIMGIAYSWTEKALKRFRKLDPEGWSERIWAKSAAERTKRATKQVAEERIERGDV